MFIIHMSNVSININRGYIKTMPIPVIARSKVWFYGLSIAGIVGLNPAGGTDVCVECCLLSGRGLCVEVSSREVLLSVTHHCV